MEKPGVPPKARPDNEGRQVPFTPTKEPEPTTESVVLQQAEACLKQLERVLEDGGTDHVKCATAEAIEKQRGLVANLKKAMDQNLEVGERTTRARDRAMSAGYAVDRQESVVSELLDDFKVLQASMLIYAHKVNEEQRNLDEAKRRKAAADQEYDNQQCQS